MDEAKIRQMIRQEIEQHNSGARFGLNPIQRHLHNGADSPRVAFNDLVRNVPVSGNITMAQATTYTIGLGISPVPASMVLFYGNATHNPGTGIDIRANCFGSALLGPSFYLQPGTSTSVKVGGPQQPIIQSSSMFLIDSSTAPQTVRAISDETHIIDVEYGGILVRATITDYSVNSITVNVETLAANWTIIGNWVII